MTFLEVEDILGFTLPKSAYEHEAWWYNRILIHSPSLEKMLILLQNQT
ncbi:DUF7662 domain-containing protein [Cytobacillus sp. FSL R5-0596]